MRERARERKKETWLARVPSGGGGVGVFEDVRGRRMSVARILAPATTTASTRTCSQNGG
jgi:hypothetical protein